MMTRWDKVGFEKMEKCMILILLFLLTLVACKTSQDAALAVP